MKCKTFTRCRRRDKTTTHHSPVTLENSGKQPDGEVGEGRGQLGVRHPAPDPRKPVQRQGLRTQRPCQARQNVVVIECCQRNWLMPGNLWLKTRNGYMDTRHPCNLPYYKVIISRIW